MSRFSKGASVLFQPLVRRAFRLVIRPKQPPVIYLKAKSIILKTSMKPVIVQELTHENGNDFLFGNYPTEMPIKMGESA